MSVSCFLCPLSSVGLGFIVCTVLLSSVFLPLGMLSNEALRVLGFEVDRHEETVVRAQSDF